MISPDESTLLDDVLAESAPAHDSLGPMLSAVRSRRRRRHAAPVVGAVLAVALAAVWWRAPWSGRQGGAPPLEITTSAPVLPVAPSPFQRISTRALPGSDRVITGAGLDGVTRVATTPDPGLRATDEELFALAGGRGVALFRFPGRTELFIAGTP